MKTLTLCLASILALASAARAASPVPDRVPCAVPDRQAFQDPDAVQLSGWLGTRVLANESNRLARIDPDRWLEGYRHRPGRQSWDGEHVGKWLHAATLAWVYTGDPALRKKLDLVAAELVKCQLPDGYLGTYVDKDRWTDWDVWAHKYNLIGLITYMRYTGNLEPLPACRKMGDLLCATFGDEPGKRDLIQAGHHVGMAPTSVLEPMVLLYRFTGDTNYLAFCKYILRAWEQPNGPKIVSTLLGGKGVDKVGNGKAYEMLSCLNGALEVYRTTGDQPLFQACLNAWQDIVDHRLYPTGGASYDERFHGDFDFPNVHDVGETCVTVTWLQFNAQLLRLTGEARFAEQLERVILNQLFGAQRPDGCAWGYYVQMEGTKPYSDTLDGHCCLSSGPRGVALIPTFAFTTDADGAVVNLYDAGSARLKLKDGREVKLTINTRFPAEDQVRIRIDSDSGRPFELKLRTPAWCRRPAAELNSKSVPMTPGYTILPKVSAGDELVLTFPREPRVIPGDHMNAGKALLQFGPLVLAADETLLNGIRLNAITLAGTNLVELAFQPETAPAPFHNWTGAQSFRVNGLHSGSEPGPNRIGLLPFADAGATGGKYEIWIPVQQNPSPATAKP
ncbi:MAG: glycoside hydrolase family 127 protein [Verrucomicrobiota bacterium]